MKQLAMFMLLMGGMLYSMQSWADASMLEQGSQVFDHWCQPCHGDGPNYPGTTALRAKYQGAIEPVLAARKDMTPEFVTLYVRNGISVMPFFRKTEISEVELDALTAYLTRH
jgi:mono/diheme cytochrome c family protein